jgi:hypothetical protein
MRGAIYPLGHASATLARFFGDLVNRGQAKSWSEAPNTGEIYEPRVFII